MANDTQQNSTETSRETVEKKQKKIGKFRKWFQKFAYGKFSDDEIALQEKEVDRNIEIENINRELSETTDEDKKKELKKKQKEILGSLETEIAEVRGSRKKRVLKGVGAAATNFALFLSGAKIVPDAARYIAQRAHIKRERKRILESGEPTEQSDEQFFEDRYNAMQKRIKESQYLSVEKRNYLLKRLEKIQQEREEKLRIPRSMLNESVAVAISEYEYSKGGNEIRQQVIAVWQEFIQATQNIYNEREIGADDTFQKSEMKFELERQ